MSANFYFFAFLPIFGFFRLLLVELRRQGLAKAGSGGLADRPP